MAYQWQKQKISLDELTLHGPAEKVSNFKGRRRKRETDTYGLSPSTKVGKAIDSKFTGILARRIFSRETDRLPRDLGAMSFKDTLKFALLKVDKAVLNAGLILGWR